MAGPSHVLITGASSGLGAALARFYADASRRLSLFGRDEARLRAVAETCRAKGGPVATYCCDLRDAAATAHSLEEADSGAPVDLLIVNAGLGGAFALAQGAGETAVQAASLIETNVLGVINTVTPLLPKMLERRSGHVVLVGSAAGLIGLPHSPVYCASKAAVHTYGESLRRRLAGAGVSVTVVCPGFVDTPMSDSLPLARPFLWTADRSAAHIARGIARKRRTLIFPWQIRVGVAAARWLPQSLVDAAIRSPRFGQRP